MMDKLRSSFEKSINGIYGFDLSVIDKIIVAYSGGADSSLLLRLAADCFIPRGVNVEAAHLNHMIRGDEAYRDEKFCIDTADKLGIRCNVKRTDIPALCKEGGSVEDVARRERYAFFDDLIEENEKKGLKTCVFTAHNADDNLETVIFNLIRGTALKGMCGIPSIRDGKFVRPLLFMTGAEIRNACNSYGISYVTDSTNSKSDYTRNYIRHNVIPHLEKLSSSPQFSIMRMCSALRTDEDFIDGEVNKFLKEYTDKIPVSDFIKLHTAIGSRVLIKLYDEYAASVGEISHLEKVHVDAILDRISRDTVSFSISVPCGISFVFDGREFWFEKRNRITSGNGDKRRVSLEKNVPAEFFGGEVILTDDYEEISVQSHENIYNLFIHKGIKFDKIKGKLIVRTR